MAISFHETHLPREWPSVAARELYSAAVEKNTATPRGRLLAGIDVLRRLAFPALGLFDLLVDLSAVNRHVLWSLDSQAHLVTPDRNHSYDNLVADHDAFVLFPGENEHGHFSSIRDEGGEAALGRNMRDQTLCPDFTRRARWSHVRISVLTPQ